LLAGPLKPVSDDGSNARATPIRALAALRFLGLCEGPGVAGGDPRAGPWVSTAGVATDRGRREPRTARGRLASSAGALLRGEVAFDLRVGFRRGHVRFHLAQVQPETTPASKRFFCSSSPLRRFPPACAAPRPGFRPARAG
jgi:hypothetical protein